MDFEWGLAVVDRKIYDMLKVLRVVFFCYFFSISISMLMAYSPGDKLVRGVGNIVSGWIEVPLTVYKKSFEKNVLQGCTVGLVEGLARFVLRTGVGCYEMVSFFLPFPPDYRPILEPEFAFEKTI